MSSFTDDMRARGMTPGSRTLELDVVPAGARLGRVLHVSPPEPVVVARRLRLADRETMAIETLHVRESLVPGLSEERPRERLLLRAAPRPLRHHHRRRPADDRAHGDERGRVARRSACRCTRPPSCSSASRARRAARSSSSSARSIAGTATVWSPSSACVRRPVAAASRSRCTTTASGAERSGQYHPPMPSAWNAAYRARMERKWS